jgi:hypothetical protein
MSIFIGMRFLIFPFTIIGEIQKGKAKTDPYSE